MFSTRLGRITLALSLISSKSLGAVIDPLQLRDYQSDAHAIEKRASCFPAVGFTPPTLGSSGTPSTPLSSWWCDDSTEQGFLGFSYDVGECQSKSQLLTDFKRMRKDYNARYVRLYSACDDSSFMNNVISSAYTAGLGVYSLIWFGFDGTDEWKGRRDALINTVKTNPLAPYVIRSIDVGSEPLYDWVLSPSDLAAQVTNVKNQVKSYGIKVAISEMQYGYTVQGNSQAVLDVIDVVHAHNLPFFDSDATTGDKAWPSVNSSTTWFKQKTNSTKKIIFTQTGWPTNTNIWPGNSPNAVASVSSSKAYADLLDSKCEALKTLAGHGGVGWFWQIYNDESLDGWGVLDWNNNPKFTFAPRTSC